MGWDSAPELSCRTDAWFRWSRWTLKVSLPVSALGCWSETDGEGRVDVIADSQL